MKPLWRSLLFVPANAPQRWAKAHMRGADGVIVDLEDSIEAPDKLAARTSAAEAVTTLKSNGADTLVRINNDVRFLDDDLVAVANLGLDAVLLPKVEHVGELFRLDARLTELEADRSRPTAVIAVIESPRALERIGSIADGPRLIGLALGSEDFSLSLGRRPAPLALDFACQSIAYAASARGIMGLGMACGISNFRDLAPWSLEAERAYAMGLTGALCIHPNQIAPLNAAFAPTAAEVDEAQRLLAAWDGRAGGVVSINGHMIDQPIVERARRLLRQAAPR